MHCSEWKLRLCWAKPCNSANHLILWMGTFAFLLQGTKNSFTWIQNSNNDRNVLSYTIRFGWFPFQAMQKVSWLLLSASPVLFYFLIVIVLTQIILLLDQCPHTWFVLLHLLRILKIARWHLKNKSGVNLITVVIRCSN